MTKAAQLILGMITLLVFAAGCNSNQDKKATLPPAPKQEKPREIVEIFTWWSAPGEVEAFNAYLEVFNKKFPNVDIVDLTKVEGGPDDAQNRLEQRMAENRPPDTFQVYPFLFDKFADPKKPLIESLDTLYNMKLFRKKFYASVLETTTFNDHYYAVPLGIHRRNTIYCHPELVPKPPANLKEFFEIAERLKGEGIPAIAVAAGFGDWPVMILFKAIFIASAGPAFFLDFYNGQLDMTNSKTKATLRRAISDFVKVLKYANPNSEEVNWTQAADMLKEKKVAMYIHGNWVTGYYQTLDWMPTVARSPGSDGLFWFNVDSFAISQNAPHPKNARRFLNAIGSAEGQAAFNRQKGSLPVHKDVSVKGWGEFFESTYDDFINAKYMFNNDKHLFRGFPEKVAELYRKKVSEKALLQWVIENYDTELYPYKEEKPKTAGKEAQKAAAN